MPTLHQLKKLTKDLCGIIKEIDSIEDAFNFLRDLLTETELEEFSQRLEIAIMLSQKKPYTEIQGATGASSTTIARVSKYLKGKHGGYKKFVPNVSSS